VPHPLYLEAIPGTIRYVTAGAGDKKITIKQKYYAIKIDLGVTQTPYVYGGFLQPGRPVKSYGVKIFAPDYDFYQRPDNKYDISVITSFPDSYIDLSSILFLNQFIKFIPNKSLDYKFTTVPVSDYYYFLNEYLPQDGESSWSDYIETLPDGTQLDLFDYGEYYGGQLYYAGWATYSPVNDKQESTLPPSALDKDWTLQEALEKVKDMQFWADNNLLPPIFGPTNSVYFPSNLGNTKSTDSPTARNPIIKSYPDNGLFNITNNANAKIDDIYTHTSDFSQITGVKDESYTFICNIPYFYTLDRFTIKEDTPFDTETNGDQLMQPGNGYPPGYVAPKVIYKPLQYKVNQLVKLRFIESDSYADEGLIQEQKFNNYIFTGIITKVDLPKENEKDAKAILVIKLIKDYGLLKDNYFNAKVYLVDSQRNNFVQNETYCIQRYYKKDLGIGPRLGGSIMLSNTNNFDNPVDSYYYAPTYKFTTVLKDEEKLNKPYKNISFSGSYLYRSESVPFGENYDLTHDFTKSDLPGQFEYLFDGPGGLDEKNTKQYITEIYSYSKSYLIKNLDEHDYEYYQKFKDKPIGTIWNFRELNQKPDITFGSYS
jgi:hypothetical protein